MPFSQSIKEELFVRSTRSCCLCHNFCGTKIEAHHIIPEGEGGKNDLDNGIALCFNCHAEVLNYNEKHPKGNKFTPKELKRHRDNWFKECSLPNISQEKESRHNESELNNGSLLNKRFDLPLESNGLIFKIKIEGRSEDIIDNPDLIELKPLCLKCELPLREKYGPTGMYGGVEWLVCPACGFKEKPSDIKSLAYQLRSIFIKKIKEKK